MIKADNIFLFSKEEHSPHLLREGQSCQHLAALYSDSADKMDFFS